MICLMYFEMSNKKIDDENSILTHSIFNKIPYYNKELTIYAGDDEDKFIQNYKKSKDFASYTINNYRGLYNYLKKTVNNEILLLLQKNYKMKNSFHHFVKKKLSVKQSIFVSDSSNEIYLEIINNSFNSEVAIYHIDGFIYL